MKSLSFLHTALALSTAVGLAGCGAPLAAPGTVTQSRPIATEAGRAGPWMLPEAKSEDLLYISDSLAGNVYVYAYPAGKLVGTLTGFQSPEGDCVDKSGDVFVTNYAAQNILEYAHGGTSPIAILTDPYYYSPEDCSVDSTTGNLAVTNASTISGYPGSVAIYADARGTPAQYFDDSIFFYRSCSYDHQGNLWIDGNGFTRHKEYFALAELSSGSDQFSIIKLNQHVAAPGGVQWAGRYLAVGDADKDLIYQFAIKGRTGTKAGETPLDASGPTAQFWIQAKTVIVPNLDKDSKQKGKVGFYSYPKGGAAIKTINGFKSPDGATVSLAQ
ncbi:MAG: hypothetical protein WBE30_11495 [Candidatus Cybelea sp.]